MIYEQIKTQAMAAVPFAKHVGIVIEHVERGQARAILKERSDVMNHVGSLHAGALFTLGEAASGAAMAGALAPVILNARPVATEASIKYLKLAKGTITAVGQVNGDPDALVKELAGQGKVRFSLDVTMTDDAGITVSEMKVEWHARLNR